MQHISALTNEFPTIRERAFAWRTEASAVKKLFMAFGMASVTGLMAQIRIPLPWTPVPLTGQTFAVLLAGVLLGRRWGGISMGLYMLLGIAGVQWFAGATGGLAVLMGPTGGYIAGFLPAALFVGAVTDLYPRTRKFWPMVGIMLAADFLLIHGLGIFQFGLWTVWISGQYSGISEMLLKGTTVFLAVDAIKIVAAASVATALLPKSEQT